MRLLLVAVAVTLASAANHSFAVAPGRGFGPIGETTSHAQLISLFGKANVIDRELAFPEAQCAAGTVVYADTPDEIEIGWKDSGRTRVAFVRAESKGKWATGRGVRVGTTLQRLVQ